MARAAVARSWVPMMSTSTCTSSRLRALRPSSVAMADMTHSGVTGIVVGGSGDVTCREGSGESECEDAHDELLTSAKRWKAKSAALSGAPEDPELVVGQAELRTADPPGTDPGGCQRGSSEGLRSPRRSCRRPGGTPGAPGSWAPAAVRRSASVRSRGSSGRMPCCSAELRGQDDQHVIGELLAAVGEVRQLGQHARQALAMIVAVLSDGMTVVVS